MHESLPQFVTHPNPRGYLGGNYVVVDFETTNHEHGSALDGRNSLLLACWRVGRDHRESQPGTNAYSKWGDEFHQSELVAAIASADFFVAHHAKFELQWFKRIGVDLRKVLPYDTMIGEKVLAGNRKFLLGLDATAGRRGLGSKEAWVSLCIKAGVCPSHIPARALESYCRQDVALTERVFLQQRGDLAERDLLAVHYCRNLVTPVLADIEFNGMMLDKERVSETFEDYSRRYASLESEFSALTGGINVKSHKQLAEHIYGKLGFDELTDHKGKILRTPSSKKSPHGNPKTDKETVARLAAKTIEQKAFIKVAKELIKLKTPLQNLTKMAAVCTAAPENPLVYALYNQTITQTDRLSSTGRNGGFQFHNFDRAFKKLFQARQSSRVICEGDAPQLEFRVATFLGHDAAAKADIREGVDIHAISARTMGVDRQQAKPDTFKPLYGGKSGTPRQRKYYDYFRQRYSGIYRTQSGWTMAVARDKFLTTPWGLKFYWPDAEISKTGYVTHTTQIFNYPIQSFATADIIPLVLVLVWHRIAHLLEQVMLVNTVHDSIIGEVERDAIVEYKRILVESFTRDIFPLLKRLYGIDFDVQLGVGIKSADHWGDTKDEEKFESP